MFAIIPSCCLVGASAAPGAPSAAPAGAVAPAGPPLVTSSPNSPDLASASPSAAAGALTSSTGSSPNTDVFLLTALLLALSLGGAVCSAPGFLGAFTDAQAPSSNFTINGVPYTSPLIGLAFSS